MCGTCRVPLEMEASPDESDALRCMLCLFCIPAWVFTPRYPGRAPRVRYATEDEALTALNNYFFDKGQEIALAIAAGQRPPTRLGLEEADVAHIRLVQVVSSGTGGLLQLLQIRCCRCGNSSRRRTPWALFLCTQAHVRG